MVPCTHHPALALLRHRSVLGCLSMVEYLRAFCRVQLASFVASDNTGCMVPCGCVCFFTPHVFAKPDTMIASFRVDNCVLFPYRLLFSYDPDPRKDDRRRAVKGKRIARDSPILPSVGLTGPNPYPPHEPFY